MKTIAEPQREVRELKKEIGERLDSFEEHLSEYKIQATKDTEFQRIFDIASLMPTFEHPFAKMDMNTKTTYMGILLFFSTWNHAINDQQKLFLQRIILSDEYANQLDLYVGNLGNITFDNIFYKLDESVKQFAPELILDLLIVIHLSDKREDTNFLRRRMELVADIAGILRISREFLFFIINCARAILTQNLEEVGLNAVQMERLSKYRYYFVEIPGFLGKEKQFELEKWTRADSYLIGGSH